jgi:hypothetical protein
MKLRVGRLPLGFGSGSGGLGVVGGRLDVNVDALVRRPPAQQVRVAGDALGRAAAGLGRVSGSGGVLLGRRGLLAAAFVVASGRRGCRVREVARFLGSLEFNLKNNYI